MRKFIVAVVVIGFVSVGYAQEGRRGGGPAAGGPVVAQGGPYVRLNVESETVKGAPYSADVVNESVQMLPDGNRIVNRSTSRMYRDGEGRTRREEDRPSGLPGSPAILISDPVAASSWTLNTDNRVARQSPAALRAYNTAIGDLGLRLSGLEAQRLVSLNGQIVVSSAPNLTRSNGEQRAEERLAPRTIEGVRVEGVRRTTTIAAGAIGNERPIVVTSEEWTSPELKVVVLSESNDPRTGTSSYKLTNLRRGDQPASLFQVPSDYTVQPAFTAGGLRGEGRGDGRRGGAPQR